MVTYFQGIQNEANRCLSGVAVGDGEVDKSNVRRAGDSETLDRARNLEQAFPVDLATTSNSAAKE